MRDDFFQRLQYLQEELLSEEEDSFDADEEFQEDELGPGYNYAVDSARAIYEDEDYDEPDYAPPVKKKGIGGLVILALLEIAGILAIIGWWKQWLN